ncbi:MAG: Rrf2 family transcriptional regulator [Acidimicrobiia bacterium]|nr:Rrf2 family transcriptional regulator [Acidimicrobiia bacterium]MDX2467504.1 Rrf2 family transcriptional regulator [Acidimicrobiia bacterium]
MKIVPTRRADYGVRALINLAQNHPGGQAAPAISKDMDIPVGFLRQVLQELGRAGLVNSQPGRTGGYALAKEPDTITLFDIISALEGPSNEPACALDGGPCHWDRACAIHWVWLAAREAFTDKLKSATLAQIAFDDSQLREGNLPAPLVEKHR